jgi:antitoxin component YwqK of YwqJK toxin-antitoxin module
MKITLKKLKELKACKAGIKWFEEHFGEEAEHTAVIKLLEDQKDRNGYITFIFMKFKLSGKCRRWGENGELFCETNYKNGKRHGVAKYYENGKLCCVDKWEKGVLINENHIEEA